MPGTITVGLDGTDHALAAADWAAHEAARRGMDLRLVHAWVWRGTDTVYIGDRAMEERWVRNVLNEAEARVAKVYPDLNVTTELLVDDPVPTLVAEAARAEMLVLGSRGYGTLTGYLVGSVSLQVLRQATGPIVMVRGPRQTTVQQRFDEVVVGVQEAEEAGGPVLEFAFAAAAERGATLRAVRAWSIPSVLSWSPGSMWLADQAGGLEPLHKEILADALGPWRQKYPDVDVIEHVEIGAAAEVLLSNSSRASLVVVGRRTHDTGLRRLGSVTHAVLHHAPGAVAVVPHP
ncbi:MULTISPECIES: universal stress protein [unclassified Streptomyces]|uniref:universal stress protein n=1 Tax=unclassified Streptomyces TaxID=2593676 RepID=UPI002DDC3D57|nr:universal stress protein [Streptomyces sp. NBC_01750]WSA98571.1 universal stress protein [Streptomyces sp. NBC_01794]WSD36893.1 universal stress protein [Streptomyces sp. NBC_01750]